MSWNSEFASICQTDAPLSAYTWYKLGGPARWLFEPRDERQLARLVHRCAAAGVAWRVLGCGANVLVSDRGFDGAVVRLEKMALDNDLWGESGTPVTPFQISVGQASVPATSSASAAAAATRPVRGPAATGVAAEMRDAAFLGVAAGEDFPRFVKRTLEAGRVGLEALAGIPGTIGGVVRMNAGGRHGEVKDFIRAVRIVDDTGAARWLTRAAVGFQYRHTNLTGQIVTAAAFDLPQGDRPTALARFREIWHEKYEQQPPVSARSAGCIFKNPPGHSAGRLIDQAGLKGVRAGGAEISTRHANFIVAHEGATSTDILKLIALAQERVGAQFGVALETEVELW